eukprot:318350-Chlamydomonas_euryale.AAC.1
MEVVVLWGRDLSGHRSPCVRPELAACGLAGCGLAGCGLAGCRLAGPGLAGCALAGWGLAGWGQSGCGLARPGLMPGPDTCSASLRSSMTSQKVQSHHAWKITSERVTGTASQPHPVQGGQYNPSPRSLHTPVPPHTAFAPSSCTTPVPPGCTAPVPPPTHRACIACVAPSSSERRPTSSDSLTMSSSSLLCAGNEPATWSASVGSVGNVGSVWRRGKKDHFRLLDHQLVVLPIRTSEPAAGM